MLAIAIFALSCLLVACGSTSNSPFRPGGVAAVALTIDPVNSSLPVGTSQQLHATAAFSDGTTKDVTDTVAWTSANMAVATIGNAAGAKGLLTGVGMGAASIRVTLTGTQGSSQVTVTPATLTFISVTAPQSTLAKGTSQQLSATCTFSDNTTQDCTSQVSWSSANTVILQVGDAAGSKGVLTALAIGSASVNAAFQGMRGSALVTVTAATLVSVTVTPPDSTIAKGTTAQFRATGTFTDQSSQDLTDQATWISSDAAVAQVADAAGSKGLATAISEGTASIDAAFGGIQGVALLTVDPPTLAALTITSPQFSIAKGTTRQLNATCAFSNATTQDCTDQVSWTSADNTVAQVSNQPPTNGLVTGLGVGSTSIGVALNGIHGSSTVTVTAAILSSLVVDPHDISLAKGTTAQLSATCVFSDSTTQNCAGQVSWTSADNTIAQVSGATDSTGLVTALSVGNTSIIATFGGVQDAAAVTVTPAVLASIALIPANPTMPSGTSLQMIATGHFSDGTVQDLTQVAEFSSSNPDVVVTDNIRATNGLIFAVNPGVATVIAKSGGVLGSTQVTVATVNLISLTIDPSDPSVPVGTSLRATAIGVFSDGTNEDLTASVSWISSSNSVAQVSNAPGSEGVITGISSGLATIGVTLDGISATTPVTVTRKVVSRIIVTPANPTVHKGDRLQMIATLIFSDGTQVDYTSFVSWTSSDKQVAHVLSNQGNGKNDGILVAIQPGLATIQATFEGVSGSTLVTVLP